MEKKGFLGMLLAIMMLFSVFAYGETTQDAVDIPLTLDPVNLPVTWDQAITDSGDVSYYDKDYSGYVSYKLEGGLRITFYYDKEGKLYEAEIPENRIIMFNGETGNINVRYSADGLLKGYNVTFRSPVMKGEASEMIVMDIAADDTIYRLDYTVWGNPTAFYMYFPSEKEWKTVDMVKMEYVDISRDELPFDYTTAEKLVSEPLPVTHSEKLETKVQMKK